MKYDVAIIGGGLAGLSAAAAIAAAGKNVIVLEQYSIVGGSTHIFRRRGGWEWQVGVHHVGDCGPDGDMPTAFRGLGLGDHITYAQMDPTGQERYLLPGLEFDLPANWDEFLDRLVAHFPRERRNLRRFVSAVIDIGGAVDRVTSTASVGGVAKTVLRAGRRAPLAGLSATAAMNRYDLSPEAQLLLTASPCGSLDCAPDRLPFIAMATFLDRFVRGGAWFPVGGGQVFAANLTRVIHHFGGTVVTGAHVESILVTGGRVHGVRLLDGTVVSADAVISTADIKKTYGSLLPPEAVSARDARRVAAYRMSSPFFNTYLGVEVELAGRYPNRDHFVLPTWNGYGEMESAMRYRDDDTVDSWKDRVAPIVPSYVHCSEVKDTSRRYSPEGCSSIEVMWPIPMSYRLWGSAPDDIRGHEYAAETSSQYHEVKEFLIDRMVDHATTVYPEITGKIVHREAATAMTQERYTQSSQGASYGIEWNLRQNAVLRPGSTTAITGLFLAGASCRSGPGTEGVLLSGIAAAGSVLNRELMEEFRAGRFLVPDDAIGPVEEGWDPLRESAALVGGDRFGTDSRS